MHDAELDSAIASIWILPPGQVTETSFSPGLQMSSHLVLHAGWKSACRLVVPAGLAGPGGPGGPAGPTRHAYRTGTTCAGFPQHERTGASAALESKFGQAIILGAMEALIAWRRWPKSLSGLSNVGRNDHTRHRRIAGCDPHDPNCVCGGLRPGRQRIRAFTDKW